AIRAGRNCRTPRRGARSGGSGGTFQAGRTGARERSGSGPRRAGRAAEAPRAGQGGAGRATEACRRQKPGSSSLPDELAGRVAGRESPVPRGVRGDQQDRARALGEGHPRRAPEDPAGASAARRARAEASLGFRDSRGARCVSRGESQDGPEDQGGLGERHSGAEEDARPRAPVFRPQGLSSRLGAGHPTGEDRLPGGASGAARGAEGPLDRSERLAEAVVRQELSGDAAEELGRDHRGGESALPRGESGDRRQGPGSVAEDPNRDARRDDEGVARLAAARLSGEARNEDRKSTRLNSSHVAISYAVF